MSKDKTASLTRWVPLEKLRLNESDLILLARDHVAGAGFDFELYLVRGTSNLVKCMKYEAVDGDRVVQFDLYTLFTNDSNNWYFVVSDACSWALEPGWEYLVNDLIEHAEEYQSWVNLLISLHVSEARLTGIAALLGLGSS